jgi:hypothetical protein
MLIKRREKNTQMNPILKKLPHFNETQLIIPPSRIAKTLLCYPERCSGPGHCPSSLQQGQSVGPFWQ